MTQNSTNTNNDKDIEFEKQKIVYDKASELHRYYLSWDYFNENCDKKCVPLRPNSSIIK